MIACYQRQLGLPLFYIALVKKYRNEEYHTKKYEHCRPSGAMSNHAHQSYYSENDSNWGENE